MGVNSLLKTVTRQRRYYDLNPGPSAPESSTLTTRLSSHPANQYTHVGLTRMASRPKRVVYMGRFFRPVQFMCCELTPCPKFPSPNRVGAFAGYKQYVKALQRSARYFSRRSLPFLLRD